MLLSESSENLLDHEDIFALASPPGASAIAVIRISGPTSFHRIKNCIRFALHARAKPIPRFAHYCQFVDPTNSQSIDDLLMVYFEQGKSFTGEESIELYPHGSPYVVQTIIKCLRACGFREAIPGEFTKRAFIAGKVDLIKAEGIGALCQAISRQQWIAAKNLTTNGLSIEIERLRQLLIEGIAILEALIDFPDEKDTAGITLRQIKGKVELVQKSLAGLISSFSSGRVALSGLRVALIGAPNVGKSTLLNLLVGIERSIVTEIAGTTRDYIEERFLINGRLASIIDTAGIRKTEDKIEEMGIDRSLKIAETADLVLLISEAINWQTLDSYIESAIQKLTMSGQTKVIRVFSKADQFAEASQIAGGQVISCATGYGMAMLKEKILEEIDAKVALTQEKDSVFLATQRQMDACLEADQCLQNFLASYDDAGYDEFLAFELRQAAQALSEMIGNVDNEDVLDVVFSTFCVGK